MHTKTLLSSRMKCVRGNYSEEWADADLLFKDILKRKMCFNKLKDNETKV